MRPHDKPDHSIDLNGLETAFSLLKILQILRKMRVGEELEIRRCDAETRTDLFRVLPPGACRVMAGKGTSPHRFILVKAAAIRR